MPSKILRRDQFGLSMDPVDWADPDCNACYGQGTTTMRDANNNTFNGPCGCTNKSYRKVRVVLEDVLKNIEANKEEFNGEVMNKDKIKEATVTVVRAAHEQIRESGRVRRFELSKLANKVLAQKVIAIS